jgi:RHS repeat-associated protein
VLQPRMVTDINDDRRAVSFSPLGLVTATAVMGKEGEQLGDTLDTPGSRLEYDFFAYVNHQHPVFVRSIVREHHVTETDVPLPERDATIESIQYSDGFGRLLQTRTQAEDVLFGDPNFGGSVLPIDQSVSSGDVVGRQRAEGDSLNVVVSGWQVYDNKGRVIEKFEPFFSVGQDYDIPSDAQMGKKVMMFYDPRGQVIRTLNPDGSEQRVIYGIPADLTNLEQFAPTPWEAYTYDANDLAPLSQRPDGTSLTDAAPTPHHFTPSSIVIDALGRTVLAVACNRDKPQNAGDPLPPIQEILTQTSYDIRGNVLAVTDALKRVAFRYTYDLANRPWRTESIDAGLRRIVLNVIGNEIERRDSKGALSLQSYDLLHRPIRLWARDDAEGLITLRQQIEYGDAGNPSQPSSDRAAMQASNLLGQLVRHHDEAGLISVSSIDFKGNVLDKSRRVIADAPILAVFEQASANAWQVTPFQVDWEQQPGQSSTDRDTELLEDVSYQTTASYDALNRIKRMQFPQDVEGKRRELRPEYNRAGGLEQVWLDDALYVERIAYDAKGQRALIAYGNGVMTRYAYDPQTFRLKRLRSEHYSKPSEISYHPTGAPLQDFGYDYDLVGNIMSIQDRTPGSGILNNPQALTTDDPVLKQLLAGGDALNRYFEYDTIYRLLSATGRECDAPPQGPAWEDEPRCTDITRTRAYTERYVYDAMGNILQMNHHSGSNGFTREFTIESMSNRLQRMQIGTDPYDYIFDANGNMLSEATSHHFEWNHADQMKVFRTQTQGAAPSVYAHYLYDSTGQRVKKLVRKQGTQFEITHYIDGIFEHHRWISGAGSAENNHLHLMDDRQRIAIIRVGVPHPDDKAPAVQFHLGDHLASSNLVVDKLGALVNREEFTPYGETSFGSFTKKRYRFTGKERDEESGLNYHGARYYVPGIARWQSCDPVKHDKDKKVSSLVSPYCYVLNNPLLFMDPDGKDVYILVNVNGREIDYAAIATRKAEIEQIIRREQRWGKDAIYVINAFDLGTLKSQVDADVYEAKQKGYGKTVEFSEWGHGGSDGPRGEFVVTSVDDRLGEGKKENRQLKFSSWANIDFNFDPKHSLAVFYGCKELDFAERFLKAQPSLQFAGGYDESSYPSKKSDTADWHTLAVLDEMVDAKMKYDREHGHPWKVYFVGQSFLNRKSPVGDSTTSLKIIDRSGHQRKVEPNADVDLINRGWLDRDTREADRP